MYLTIKENAQNEIVEKKSKFIASIFYVESKNEAEDILKKVKKQYFDARHNCSAYRVLEKGKLIQKASDDGEPSGTAGIPMLNILEKNNYCNVLVIVTRYFGGILLGTGGLVRCYSESTKQVLEKAKTTKLIECIEFEIIIGYSDFENFKYYCNKNDININKIEYLNEIKCNIDVENQIMNNFLNDIEKKKINIINYEKICEKLTRKSA